MKLVTRMGHMLAEPPPPSPKEGTLLVLVSPLGTSRVPGPVLTRDTQQRAEQTGCLPLSGRSSYSEDGEGSKHAYGLNRNPQKGTLESSPPRTSGLGGGLHGGAQVHVHRETLTHMTGVLTGRKSGHRKRRVETPRE